ncbi:YncE family protein [Janthinobacterium sp. Ant5-2-1]|uniref:YncE family protein n=1 Tax=Janthinobacterium sp. Ant5-2-1 TaxID=1755239 RepID=UPI000AD7E46E|nr:hypothetical protein [Janthinobacterium sp. Ant5-2-1]
MNSRKQGPALRWLGASLLAMAMLAGCGGGSSSDGSVVTPPAAVVPQAVVVFAGAVSAAAEGADAIGSMGAPIELDAGGSKDSEGNALSFAWSIVSKPTDSSLSLQSATAAKLGFQADVLGSYVFKLRVTNSKGGFAEKNVTVLVNNRVPNAVIVVNATFTAQPVVKTPVAVSIGSGIVLDATGSIDADGDKVTTTWELIQKPASSTSVLFAAGQTARFSPDVLGLYKVRARGADGKGAYAETVYQFDVNNSVPTGVIQGTVAVVSRDKQTVPVGQPVVTSGILSYDEGGAQLIYAWAVDSRPAGSVAVLGAATAAVPSFTPDVAGAYVLSLTVGNGRQTAVAYLNLNAVTSTSSVVALPFKPLDMRYSQAVDRLVVVTAEPNAMKVINPTNGAIVSIDLPTTVKAFNLSPDGKLAGVLHDSVVSLVDLVTGTVLKSTGTGGTQTEVFVTNDGVVFLSGQALASSARPAVAVINARTGQALPPLDFGAGGGFFGVLRGAFAVSKNKAFLSSGGSSSLSYFTIDPQTNAILDSGSVYGDYYMMAPFFLSPKEDLLFSANGSYFNTDTLKYVGRFTFGTGSTGQTNAMLSMSYSPTTAEVLLMESSLDYVSSAYDTTYKTSYKKYSGELLFPAGSVSLPVIGGETSYGIGVFHTSAGESLAVVQTGGAQKGATRAKYYLVYR